MLVTGVQTAGSKGVSAVQGTVVDTSRAVRHSPEEESTEARRAAGQRKSGDPQPVVFQRKGVDNRPIALRHEQAAARYRADGDPDHDEAA
jgi:hypothetical protein